MEMRAKKTAITAKARSRATTRSGSWFVVAAVALGVGTPNALAAPRKGPSRAAANPSALAAEFVIHPDLVRAQRKFEKARGGEAYLALRRVWDTWGRANPQHVEEALALASESSRHDAGVRAYARLLGAYARVRRGDLASAQSSIRAQGFVDRWLLVGPFDNEGKSGLGQEFGPEAEPGAPIVPGRAYTGKERPVRWRVVPDAFPYGWIDTGSLIRPELKTCAYATTFVSGDEDQKRDRTITAFVGAGGAFRLFFNGQQVLEDEAYRGYDAGRYAAALRLRPGINRLTIKVCGDEAAPIFSVRLGDERGEPDPTLVVSNDVRLSERAAPTVAAVLEEKPDVPEVPRALIGPLQDFERRVGDDTSKARAADLETFAAYLVESKGDDPTTHEARDLARKAAEKSPTVDRLLLAATLSEDRNQAGSWIAQARELGGDSNVDVLLARAWHEGTGPSPRKAFPLYDEVLALDPDNLAALRGRVELYNAAGLQRTALATLQAALRRSPESVILLNMVASQLDTLGRTTEAAEVKSRYAARRFDDSTYLTGQLELSVSRRNRALSEHWLSRLTGAEPATGWTHRVASRTYRNFGEDERALTALERARELAPEDVGILRSLADLHGELGRSDEQLRLMQDILQIRPQDREVREYVEHIKPPEAKPDEVYAMPSEEFLKLRHAPAKGNNVRTLRDLTVSTVYENGLSSSFRQVVFQPLTDASAALSRQYAFQYEADTQRVQLKGARVYRGDGSIDEAIESGEGAANDPSIAMYTSGRTYYVQFPRLEPGDVVELRYRIDDVTPRNEFADYFGEVVYLQGDDPKQNAEYVLITPKTRKLYIDQQLEGVKRSVKETDTQRIFRFVADSLPAITPEPDMPPWPELLGFIHVSTYPTWKELGRWYWGLVREQFDLDEETRKLAREITKDAKTDREKVRAVYGWVVKNTRYVALEFGIYGFKPRRCVQTVARGWGDCKDKATVIATLLKELGIDANIVILRTQLRGGFPSKLASLAPFDHAIAYVPSLDLYLDGTAEHTGSEELPIMDQGALGLHVDADGVKLVHLPPPDPTKNVIQRKVEAELRKDGSADLGIDFEVRGQDAPGWRRRYEAEATRKQRLSADLGHEFPGLELEEGGLSTGDLSDIEVPATVEIRAKAPGFGRREGDQLSIGVTPSIRLTREYASLSKRTQDVRIPGFSTRDDTFVVKLPPGARVVSAPRPVRVDTPFGSYSIEVDQKGRRVEVRTRLSLKVDRVTVAQYPAWKRFCAQVDQALGHRLVIAP